MSTKLSNSGAGRIEEIVQSRSVKDLFMAHAISKLNIELRIGAVDGKGYHTLDMVVQGTALADPVTLRKVARGGLVIDPPDQISNVLNVLKRLQEKTGVRPSAKIKLYRGNVPPGAGVGGGSAEAAALLRLMNCAFEFGLSIKELDEIGRAVGNDIPMLLRGGRVRSTGSFEHTITRIEDPNLTYLIAVPDLKLSTSTMYALHDQRETPPSGQYANDFTEIAIKLCPEIETLITLLRHGSVEAGMTGKGPAVYAGFKSEEEAVAARGKVPVNYRTFIVASVGELQIS